MSDDESQQTQQESNGDWDPVRLTTIKKRLGDGAKTDPNEIKK